MQITTNENKAVSKNKLFATMRAIFSFSKPIFFIERDQKQKTSKH